MTSQLSPIELQQENHRLQVELTELRSRYESLQRSEARYRQAFENAPISMVFISTEGEPIEMNSAAEEFLGWTIADAREANFNGRIDPTIVKNARTASLDRAIAGETVIEPPMYFDPNSTIGRGQWKCAQGHYYPIRDAAGQVQEVVEVALDLTATYEIQQKLVQERTRLLQATAQVSNLLLRASNYETVLPNVVRLLGEAAKSDRCGVMQNIDLHPILHQPAVKILIKWCKLSSPTLLELTPPSEQAFLWDDVPEAYETLARGQVFNRLVENIPEPGQSLLKALGNNSCLFLPILVEGKLWGLLNFDNFEEPRLNNEAEIAILQVAAESLAAAIARQAKDEELRESEHRYRTLFELSSEGILRFGYHQSIPLSLSVDEQLELCYQSVYIAEGNNAFAQMYEYEKAEDLIGLTLNDFHDRDSEVTKATMQAYVENKHSARNTEMVRFDRYGRKRYFLNSSVSTIENDCVVSTWVSQVDITELREAQQVLLEAEQKRCLRLASQSQKLEHLNTSLKQTLDRLSASEERYRNLFEISSEGIYRFEFEQPIPINLPVEEQVELVYRYCRLAEANATYAAMYNKDNPKTLIGLRLTDVHVMESEQNRAMVRAIVRSGYQLRNAETKEVDLEGNPRYFLNNITTIIRNGCATGGWASQLDITELRLAQQALLKSDQTA